MVTFFNLEEKLKRITSLERSTEFLTKAESQMNPQNLLNLSDLEEVNDYLMIAGLSIKGMKIYLEKPNALRQDLYGYSIPGLLLRWYHGKTGKKTVKDAIGEDRWNDIMQTLINSSSTNLEKLLNLKLKFSYDGLLNTDNGLVEELSVGACKTPHNKEEELLYVLEGCSEISEQIKQNIKARSMLRRKFDLYWKEPLITSKDDLECTLSGVIEYYVGKILVTQREANIFVNGVETFKDIRMRVYNYIGIVLNHLKEDGIIEETPDGTHKEYQIKGSLDAAYNAVVKATARAVCDDTYDKNRSKEPDVKIFRPER